MAAKLAIISLSDILTMGNLLKTLNLRPEK